MSNTLPLLIGAGILFVIISGSKKSTSSQAAKLTPAGDSGLSFKPGYIVQKGPSGIKCSELIIKDSKKAMEYAYTTLPEEIKKEAGDSHFYTAQQARNYIGGKLFGINCFDSIVMTDEIAQFMYDLYINTLAGVLALDLYVGGVDKLNAAALPELKSWFSKKGFKNLKWIEKI